MGSTMRMTSITAAFLLSSLLGVGPASAATLAESSLPGGAFSTTWSAPTIVGAGFDQITGTGNQNQFDNLVFTSLAPGAQTLTFSFTAPAGINTSYAAGGSLLFKTSPFLFGWDGTTFGSVFVGFFNQTSTATLTLGPAFSGPLYVALNFTFGNNLGYAISVPSNTAPPAAVPVPGAGLLLASALGLGALVARQRRRLSRSSDGSPVTAKPARV